MENKKEYDGRNCIGLWEDIGKKAEEVSFYLGGCDSEQIIEWANMLIFDFIRENPQLKFKDLKNWYINCWYETLKIDEKNNTCNFCFKMKMEPKR